MPFALIPEGFKLQKVTKAQQQAIDKYYSDKNTQAFLEGDGASELVKVAAIVVTPIVLAALAKRGYEFADDEVKDIVGAVTEGATGVGENLLDRINDAIGQLSGIRSF